MPVLPVFYLKPNPKPPVVAAPEPEPVVAPDPPAPAYRTVECPACGKSMKAHGAHFHIRGCKGRGDAG